MNIKKIYTICLITGGVVVGLIYITIALSIFTKLYFWQGVVALISAFFSEYIGASPTTSVYGMIVGSCMLLTLKYVSSIIPRFLQGLIYLGAITGIVSFLTTYCSALPFFCFGESQPNITFNSFLFMIILGSFLTVVIGQIALLCYKLLVKMTHLLPL